MSVCSSNKSAEDLEYYIQVIWSNFLILVLSVIAVYGMFGVWKSGTKRFFKKTNISSKKESHEVEFICWENGRFLKKKILF